VHPLYYVIFTLAIKINQMSMMLSHNEHQITTVIYSSKVNIYVHYVINE